MKSIPASLLMKTLQAHNGIGTNSEPHVRVLVTQAAGNTLLSESIHGKESASPGDVAVRMTSGEGTPHIAYAICIDEGEAKIYTREFPAFSDLPWNYVFTLGPAQDAAIEFDGKWKMDQTYSWYYLETDEFPWIFFTDAGVLYAQYWDDENTRVQLATDVTGFFAIRGWQNQYEPWLDQGLLVAFLSGTKVYYRARCCQEDGSYIWEPQTEVYMLTDGNETISVFRTNDFRLGFLTEYQGIIRLAFTDRTYAGMSVKPEYLAASVSKVSVRMQEAAFHNVKEPTETMNADLLGAFCMLYENGETPEELSAINVEKLYCEDSTLVYGFRVSFSRKLYNTSGIDLSAFVSLSLGTVSRAWYDDAEECLVIHTTEDITKYKDVTVTIRACGGVCWYSDRGQRWYLTACSIVAPADTENHYAYSTETLSATVSALSLNMADATFKTLQAPTESLGATVTGVIVTLEAASVDPI